MFSTNGLPGPYWDTVASIQLLCVWLLVDTVHVSRTQERRFLRPLQLCLCAHPCPIMASVAYEPFHQVRNCEFPCLAAPEQPSLADISACVIPASLTGCRKPTAHPHYRNVCPFICLSPGMCTGPWEGPVVMLGAGKQALFKVG